MSSLPLRYWCQFCNRLLFRTDREASGLVEVVCQYRDCPDRGPRVVRVPEHARDTPRGEVIRKLPNMMATRAG